MPKQRREECFGYSGICKGPTVHGSRPMWGGRSGGQLGQGLIGHLMSFRVFLKVLAKP